MGRGRGEFGAFVADKPTDESQMSQRSARGIPRQPEAVGMAES